MSEQQGAHCRKDGGCLDQCGRPMSMCPSQRESKTQYEQSPLLPAEKICLQALGSVVESRAKPILVDSLASISYDLDRAIALPAVTWDEDDSVEHDFRQAKQNIFHQVVITLHRTQATSLESLRGGDHLSSALQLRRLGIFMPAFKTRVEGKNLSRDLVDQTHRGLCNYIGELHALMHQPGNGGATRKKQIASHLTECETMGLIMRTGKMTWPALAREEASHARKQFNHDFYTLNSQEKTPYQVKTSADGKGYRGVVVVQHYDILRAMKRDPTPHRVDWNPPKGHADFEWPNPYIYQQILVGETPDPLAELLVEESRLGSRLSKEKRNALSLASSYVLSKRRG